MVQFRYTYPLLFLDFLDTLTGEGFLSQLHNFEYPRNYRNLIAIDSHAMLAMRSSIDDKFFPFILMMFDMLGGVD